jgi:hypothetical protein
MLFVASVLALSAIANAHTAGWAPGMFCQWGNQTGVQNSNNNVPVYPLYQLEFEDWWFQGVWDCPSFPPEEGVFLELEAGGIKTLELSHNIAQTTLAYNGEYAGIYPNGSNYPPYPVAGGCVNDGALHTTGQSGVGGTALMISYVSEIADVTQDNLVVISVNDT